MFCLTESIDLPVLENSKNAGMENELINLLTLQIEKLSQLEKANSFLLTKLNNEEIDDLVTIMMDRKTLDQEIQNLDIQIKKRLTIVEKNNSGILNNNIIHLLESVHNHALSVDSSLSIINEKVKKIHDSYNSKLTDLFNKNKAAVRYISGNDKRTRYEING